MGPDEIAELIVAYIGRLWPTPALVGDWIAQALEEGWELMDYRRGRQ